MFDDDKPKNAREILKTLPDHKNKSQSILTKLWVNILEDLFIGPEVYESCMQRWLNDKRNIPSQIGKEKQTARGNLNRVLFSKNITWNSFILGLCVLRVTRMRITIDLERDTHPGKISTHSLVVENLRPFIKQRRPSKRRKKE